ncbi:MAG: hypothetical protein AB8B77_08180 [Alphaproteobacteria bacterium]
MVLLSDNFDEDETTATAYVCEIEHGLIPSIRTVLDKVGFEHIHPFYAVDALRQRLKSEMPDLLIVDYEMEDPAEVIALVRDVRLGRVGTNPFLPIIGSIWRPNQFAINRMINAGVDSYFSKPMNDIMLGELVEKMVLNQNPFIVTSNYIGPDRRGEDDRLTLIPMVEAPNVLGTKFIKTSGKPKSPSKQIERALGRLNQIRLMRYGVEFMVLAARLRFTITDGDYQELERILSRFYEILRDILNRFNALPTKEQQLLNHNVFDHLNVILNELYSVRDDIDQALFDRLEATCLQAALILNPERSVSSIQLEVEQSINPIKLS